MSCRTRSANVSRPEIVSALNHNWWAINLPEQKGKISLDKIFYSLGVNKKQSASWVSLSQSKGQGRNDSKSHGHRQAQRRWPWAEGTGRSFPFMEHSIEAAHAWNQVSVGVSRPLPQVPAQDQPREHLQSGSLPCEGKKSPISRFWGNPYHNHYFDNWSVLQVVKWDFLRSCKAAEKETF